VLTASKAAAFLESINKGSGDIASVPRFACREVRLAWPINLRAIPRNLIFGTIIRNDLPPEVPFCRRKRPVVFLSE